MRFVLGRAKYWLIVNILGAAAVLYLASKLWIEPELRAEDVGRGGDLLLGGLTILPILAAFFVLDAIWLAVLLNRGVRANDWTSIPVLPSVVGLWAVVVSINRLMS